MINPSANGWIEKYFFEQKNQFDYSIHDELALYEKIRETGFIYGHIITLNSNPKIDISQWKSDEISKVALLSTLHVVYRFIQSEGSSEDFIKKTVAFYKEMTPKGFVLFDKIMTPSLNSKLESYINERVQTNKDIISKNFSHIVTNALLFVDVLAYYQYLEKGEIPEKYLKTLEETIMSIVSLSLKVKTEKSQHDDLLIKLFEASVRYTKFSKVDIKNLEDLKLNYFTTNLEKFYLLDLAGITLWNDGKVENEEVYFLHKLSENIGVSNEFVSQSITSCNEFITRYKSDIQYFNYSNPVKHFYDQTTTGVQILIKRNQKRLTKEISESKELVKLLAKSTHNDLSPEEKKKVKKQLLDICKSIPSLTIFLLPGGGLLLPILIKFIPQLLPSAFNENLDD